MPARRSAASDTLALPVDEVAKARDPLHHGPEAEPEEQRDHGDRREPGRKAELQEALDLHRDRLLARAHQEKRQVDIGERMHESEYRAGHDAALDERKDDMPECAPARSAKA